MSPMDQPSERPILQCLVTRQETDVRRFIVVNLLAWPYYESRGWEWIGLDPDREAQWQAWRDAHPEAV